MFFKRKNTNKFSGGEGVFVIVGLGNPGMKYDMTRHNAGFIAADTLARQLSVSLTKSKCKAVFGTADEGGRRLIIAKPQTYMNLSGESVSQLLSFYKVGAERLIVLCDDISLPVGKLRIRRKGSDGGQRGLRSIIEQLGTEDFLRIRIGVGAKPNPDYDLAAWVLSKFKEEEREALTRAAENAAQAALMIARGETDKAMNLYNA